MTESMLGGTVILMMTSMVNVPKLVTALERFVPTKEKVYFGRWPLHGTDKQVHVIFNTIMHKKLLIFITVSLLLVLCSVLYVTILDALFIR